MSDPKKTETPTTDTVTPEAKTPKKPEGDGEISEDELENVAGAGISFVAPPRST